MPNWNRGIFLFLSQPQIMRFIVFYGNEKDEIILEYLSILYIYISVLFTFKSFICFENPCNNSTKCIMTEVIECIAYRGQRLAYHCL